MDRNTRGFGVHNTHHKERQGPCLFCFLGSIHIRFPNWTQSEACKNRVLEWSFVVPYQSGEKSGSSLKPSKQSFTRASPGRMSGQNFFLSVKQAARDRGGVRGCCACVQNAVPALCCVTHTLEQTHVQSNVLHVLHFLSEKLCLAVPLELLAIGPLQETEKGTKVLAHSEF